MNEIEKKAISQCKLLLNGDISLHVIDEDDGGTAYCGVVNKLYNKDLEIVLNLIEKQQEKIEELKQKYLLLNQVTDIEKSQYRRSMKELLKELNKDYIPKYVVREKIEELQKFIESKRILPVDIIEDQNRNVKWKIEVLQELLQDFNIYDYNTSKLPPANFGKDGDIWVQKFN